MAKKGEKKVAEAQTHLVGFMFEPSRHAVFKLACEHFGTTQSDFLRGHADKLIAQYEKSIL